MSGSRVVVSLTHTAKRTRDEDQADRDAKDRNIAEYFTKGAAKSQVKSKVRGRRVGRAVLPIYLLANQSQIVKTEDDDAFMSNLLGEMHANISPVLPRMPQKKRPSEQRSRVRALSPAAETRQPKRVRISEAVAPPTPSADGGDDDVGFAPSIHHDVVPSSDDIPMSDPMPSSPTVRVANRKGQTAPAAATAETGQNDKDEDEDEDAIMEVAHAGTVNAASVNLTAARPVKKVLKTPAPYPSPERSSPTKAPEAAEVVDTSSWTSLNQKLNVMSSPQTGALPSGGKMDYRDAVEEDGSLRFFWTDYAEVNSSLCLFGKVLNKKTKKHVSCFVKVDEIQRKLFFLPRATRFRGGVETDETITMRDVYEEVDSLMTKKNVARFKSKPSRRKYAFELPSIPKEGQYLKVLYPYSCMFHPLPPCVSLPFSPIPR